MTVLRFRVSLPVDTNFEGQVAPQIPETIFLTFSIHLYSVIHSNSDQVRVIGHFRSYYLIAPLLNSKGSI